VCLPTNFAHLSSAMTNNNIDPVMIWWWLRWHKRRRQAKRKHWIHPLFHDNLNSGAYTVLNKLTQDRELFKHWKFFFISGSCRTWNSKTRYKFSYSYVSRKKDYWLLWGRKVYLFNNIQILQSLNKYNTTARRFFFTLFVTIKMMMMMIMKAKIVEGTAPVKSAGWLLLNTSRSNSVSVELF
jgi:hypothetical protein